MEYGFYTNEILQILTLGTCKSQPIPRNPSSVENSKSGLYDPPPAPRPAVQITFMATYVHSHFCQQPLPSPMSRLKCTRTIFF